MRPEFLIQLNGRLKCQHQEFSKEIESIRQSLSHINEIVAMQKIVSGSSGEIEKVSLAKLIEYALHMTNKSIKGMMPISIDTFFEEVPFIYVNKLKVLQTLINLISNAKDAVSENDSCKEGKIVIKLKNLGQNICIGVFDNGIGIDKAHRQKMFKFGFTTKKNGHRFGLHGSALLAKEVDGYLEAKSKGKGKGATFTLCLKTNTKT